MAASLAFVTGPSDTPTEVLSLTKPANTGVLARDFSPGSPTLEAGPESVGGTYGYRTCSFVVQINDAYGPASTAAQAVVRQLLAPRNWLMVKPTATNKPMFLRTYRTAQAELEWENAGANIWELPVTLVCDAGLYGARTDAVASLVVTNNPETATRGLYVDVPAVKGDLETAPVVWFPSSSLAMDGAGVWVASEASPAGGAYRAQAANGTVANSTTVVADATFSGGNKTTTTFTFSQLLYRVTGLSVTASGGGAAVPVGDYRVFVRAASSAASANFTLRLTIGGIVQSPVTWTTPATANSVQMVDLGVYQLPAGSVPPQFGLSGAVPAATTTLIDVAAARTSGNGDLSLDYLLFMPATNTLGNLILAGSGTGSAVIDGPNGMLYQVNTASPFAGTPNYVSPSVPPEIAGGLPMLSPGVTTRLHLVLAGSGAAVAITATRTVSVSYWPQYYHLRPDLT